MLFRSNSSILSSFVIYTLFGLNYPIFKTEIYLSSGFKFVKSGIITHVGCSELRLNILKKVSDCLSLCFVYKQTHLLATQGIQYCEHLLHSASPRAEFKFLVQCMANACAYL